MKGVKEHEYISYPVYLNGMHSFFWERLLCPWDSPGKNTGVGCHYLPQGIFPTRGSNLCLLTSSALAGGFFTTSITWEAGLLSQRLAKNQRIDDTEILTNRICQTFWVKLLDHLKGKQEQGSPQSYGKCTWLDTMIWVHGQKTQFGSQLTVLGIGLVLHPFQNQHIKLKE